MTRYVAADGEHIEALHVTPGLPHGDIDRFAGYPARRIPRHQLWDWLIRHGDGTVTVCDGRDFHTLYDPQEYPS